VRLLLCAVGDAATIFVKTHVLPLELTPVAHVISGQSDEVFERAHKARIDNKQQISELYIYKDITVCLHVKTLKQQFTIPWAQTVSRFCVYLYALTIVEQIGYITSYVDFKYTLVMKILLHLYMRCISIII